ncbi:hypothetical protein GOQ27_01430 [Clostridium sp. D2Q-11]|uniref:Uncharacterized protein n=1 Tax=Anaeromonas frigoriresistens TaxID=2683708 RepID=A0A942UWW3_9FIRM|nr:hypothetical protein [Anaeromonas frigoriresistens]MBS4537102.1 hypothetical protein [Anaeromonas frigoriresistens]
MSKNTRALLSGLFTFIVVMLSEYLIDETLIKFLVGIPIMALGIIIIFNIKKDTDKQS